MFSTSHGPITPTGFSPHYHLLTYHLLTYHLLTYHLLAISACGALLCHVLPLLPTLNMNIVALSCHHLGLRRHFLLMLLLLTLAWPLESIYTREFFKNFAPAAGMFEPLVR